VSEDDIYNAMSMIEEYLPEGELLKAG
jgi:hypothetical protein